MCCENEELVSGDLPKAHESYDSKHGHYDEAKAMKAKASSPKYAVDTHQPLSLKGGK